MKSFKSTLSILGVIGSCLFLAPVIGIAASLSLALLGILYGYSVRNEKAVHAFSCASLIADFEADCDTLPVGGLKVDLWLINRDEIDLSNTVIGTGDNARHITALELIASTYAYKFTGIKTSNASSITMNKGKYANNYVHSLSLVVFDNTSATKVNIIETLAGANLVAVVRNNWVGTNSAMEFEVLGWDVGLEGSAIEKKSDDADTQNAWKVTLASPTDQFENNAGYLLAGANQAAILAIIEDLESN